jgi:glycine/D-amino acid oxidase-like deaminating enzyme
MWGFSKYKKIKFKITGRPIKLKFNGVSVNGIEGQSIAALLYSNGIKGLRNSKSGDKRGVFCGMGVCYECAVTVNGISGKKACLESAKDGLDVRSLDYKAPHNLIPPLAPEYQINPEKKFDVVIIGSGPAGLMTARTFIGKGLKVVLIDERSSLGGQYFKQLAESHSLIKDSLSDYQYKRGSELIKEINDSEIELKLGNTVIAAEKISKNIINISLLCKEKIESINTKRLVICTGAYEIAIPFPGWTRTNVITTGAAQSLLRSYRVNAGEEVLIAGNGPLNFQLATELLDNGAKIIAVIEAAPNPFPYKAFNLLKSFFYDPKLMLQGLAYILKLKINRIPIIFKHHVTEVLDDNSLNVIISPILDGGELDFKNSLKFSADTLCVGYGFLSNNELPRILGCDHEYTAPGDSTIICDNSGRTSLEEVFVIGDGANISGAQVALCEGEITGNTILEDFKLNKYIPKSLNNTKKLLSKKYNFQKEIWSVFKSEEINIRIADEDTILCRCENVTSGNIDSILKDGYEDLSSIKRLSRAGMGRCQGRYCANMLLKKIKNINPEAITHETFAPQIPIKPFPIHLMLKEQPEWKGYKPQPVKIRKPKRFTRNICIDSKKVLNTDVVVIGGGAIGVSTSLFLSKSGIGNNLIEANYLNSQASGNNAGSLHLQLLSFDFELNKVRESPQIKSLVLQKKGIEIWELLEKELKSDFELKRTGGLMVAENNNDIIFLKNKINAEKKVGIEMELIGGDDIKKFIPHVSKNIIAAAYCPGEGKINPMLATPSLAKEAERLGTKFHLETTVLSITKGKKSFFVETNRGRIKCKYLVNAAGGWSSNIAEMLGIKMPVQSAPQQMIVTESSVPIIPSMLSHAHRHLTMKQISNGNLIIGGGWFAGYNNKINKTFNYRNAISGNLWAAQRVIPSIGHLNILRTWATVGVMIDGAPILGETPGIKNFYQAVGANGFTMAPMMGKILSDLIKGNSLDVKIEPFSLNRF